MTKQSLTATLQLIHSDMQYRCEYEHKQLNFLRILGFLVNQAVISQVLYRVQIFFYTHHLSWLAGIFQGINSFFFTVNIDSTARIGRSFLMLHPNYIFIGKNVTLGERCILTQQNTICPSYMLGSRSATSTEGPVVGDNVLLGVGSTLTGDIKIGRNSKVAVNSAVDKSFPDNAMLVGVPAKNLAIG